MAFLTTNTTVDVMKAELQRLSPDIHPFACRLLTEAIAKTEKGDEPEYLETDSNTPIHLVRKVLIPYQKNPQFNYVGKILGPGGQTVQALAQQTKARFFVCGKGSKGAGDKEQELLATNDPKYNHLREVLHVRIAVLAPAVVAYQRMSTALYELQQIMQPTQSYNNYAYEQQQMETSVMNNPLGYGTINHYNSGSPMRGGRGYNFGRSSSGFRGRGRGAANSNVNMSGSALPFDSNVVNGEETTESDDNIGTATVSGSSGTLRGTQSGRFSRGNNGGGRVKPSPY